MAASPYSSSSSSYDYDDYYSSSSDDTSRTSSLSSYDVFLSFRGADTRLNFTDHLYAALNGAGISTFRDDNNLPRGENIDQELHKAIHESKCAVVVFSKDYASSESCLYELETILECKKFSNHIVLPVFYNVDPSDVSEQTGDFKEAFSKYEYQFREDIDKVIRWREALKEAAELAGLNLQNKHESVFVKEIVNAVETKLKFGMPYLGIDSQLNTVNRLLRNGSSPDLKILIICGAPGIGKTTLAKFVYNSNFMNFEASAFLDNFSGNLSQPNGYINLLRKAVSSLTKRNVNWDVSVETLEGTIRAVEASKKTIMVFDDIEVDHLGTISEWRHGTHPGSVYVFTTNASTTESPLLHFLSKRKKDFIKIGRGRYEAPKNVHFYEVGKLDSASSLKLFCMHAFGQDHPKEDYEQLSQMIVDHCEGNSLALVTLGKDSLDWKTTEDWKEAIKALKFIPQYWVEESRLRRCKNRVKRFLHRHL